MDEKQTPGLVLVTGASGGVGGRVTRLLTARGVPVRGLVRGPARAAELSPGVEPALGDYDRRDTLSQAMVGVSQVFLTTSNADVESRITQHRNVLEAAAAAGVRHVVYLSAINEDVTGGRRAATNRVTERDLREAGPLWTVLRSGLYMDALLRAAPQAAAGQIVAPAGDGRVGFVARDDIAAVGAAVLTEAGHEGRTYALTGPHALSYEDVAAAYSRALHRPVTYRDQDPDEFAAAMARWAPAHLVPVLTALYAGVRAGLADLVTDDVADVAHVAPTDLDTFLSNELTAQQTREQSGGPASTRGPRSAVA